MYTYTKTHLATPLLSHPVAAQWSLARSGSASQIGVGTLSRLPLVLVGAMMFKVLDLRLAATTVTRMGGDAGTVAPAAGPSAGG